MIDFVNKPLIKNKRKYIKDLTLGSLFDGIGAFPYAASFFGIKPVWASEILPNAISVTKRYFPDMAHLGDITKLDGTTLPPVDIITFGSPCQDLSVAGRRKGLDGERSGLFTEAIRIIDEMRGASHGKYPKYAVWENVPGALSSSAGRDFAAVLEAFAKTEIPIPGSGRWANAGMVRGRGFNIAWVIKDAQHYRVPQRRRRLFLVVDFTGSGDGAAQVLFEPKSLSRYFTARRGEGKGTALNAESGTGDEGGGIIVSASDQANAEVFHNLAPIAHAERLSKRPKSNSLRV